MQLWSQVSSKPLGIVRSMRELSVTQIDAKTVTLNLHMVLQRMTRTIVHCICGIIWGRFPYECHRSPGFDHWSTAVKAVLDLSIILLRKTPLFQGQAPRGKIILLMLPCMQALIKEKPSPNRIGLSRFKSAMFRFQKDGTWIRMQRCRRQLYSHRPVRGSGAVRPNSAVNETQSRESRSSFTQVMLTIRLRDERTLPTDATTICNHFWRVHVNYSSTKCVLRSK